MKITVDKLKGLEKKMHVVIPADDFDSAINKKFNETDLSILEDIWIESKDKIKQEVLLK